MDADTAISLTNRLYLRLDARRPEIDTLEDYYGGKQPLNFATEEWKKANAQRYVGFSDNWCAPVVNVEAERASIGGISFFGSKSRAKQYWDDLRRSKFELQFSQAVVETLTAKRSFAIVWGDSDGNPKVSFEHPSNVEIEYDWENPFERVAAIKTWVDETFEYATLYTRTELFKWQRRRWAVPDERRSQAEQAKQNHGPTGGWVPREGTEFVISNPLGEVPVVEFENRPMLRGNPISEIQGVVPMQDAINLLWAYLFLAADYASMDARVLFGDPPQVPILDKDGKNIGSRPVDMKDLREKRILTISGENASIDSWDAAKLDTFTDTIKVSVRHIATQTRTPAHYLVVDNGLSNLSGDALRTAEAALVSKVREFRAFTDDSLREILHLMALVRGDQTAAKLAPLAEFHWDKIEIRSEAQMADALSKKASYGYPFEALLEEEGKTPAQIQRIMKMREQEAEQALGMAVQGALQADLTVSDEPTAP